MRKIAVDVDGVLADLATPLIVFCNLRYGTKFEVSDLYSFDFKDIFKITREEEIKFLRDFFETDYFQNIQPVEGSQKGIKELSKTNSLNIVTARPNYVKDETCLWLEKFYNNSFSKIHFAENTYISNKLVTSKSNFCLDGGYGVMIEDDLRYANDCAEKGIESILLNRPWNEDGELHSRVQRAKNWEMVLEILK